MGSAQERRAEVMLREEATVEQAISLGGQLRSPASSLSASGSQLETFSASTRAEALN